MLRICFINISLVPLLLASWRPSSSWLCVSVILPGNPQCKVEVFGFLEKLDDSGGLVILSPEACGLNADVLCPLSVQNLTLKLFFFPCLLFEKERAREGQGEGDIDSEAGSRLSAVSTEPDARPELTNCEIVT